MRVKVFETTAKKGAYLAVFLSPELQRFAKRGCVTVVDVLHDDECPAPGGACECEATVQVWEDSPDNLQ